jgi:hypothetical protein
MSHLSLSLHFPNQNLEPNLSENLKSSFPFHYITFHGDLDMIFISKNVKALSLSMNAIYFSFGPKVN